MRSDDPKPSHLSGAYGAWFKDPRLAAAYPARPAYPEGVVQLLLELLRKTSHTVLEVGCGTGELTRRLAPSVDSVDAVDFSEAMLRIARQLPGGDASNVNWILGAVEELDWPGPYGLIVAGESLHWMEWHTVLPRMAGALAPNAMLAIVDRSWDAESFVREGMLPIIERHTPVHDYTPYDLVAELVSRGLFEVRGERRCGPEPWRPTVDDYLECRHSQRGLSRTHMGPEAVAAFDLEVRELFEQLCRAGALACDEGRLALAVEAHVVWGVPLG
jgi:SAM-dependent methyltransferase